MATVGGYQSVDSSKQSPVGFVLVGVTALILLFSIIGIALPYTKLEEFGVSISATLWESGETDTGCDSLDSHITAARAFGIINILLLGASVGVLLLSAVGKGLPGIVPVAIVAGAWFCLMLTWALEAAIVTSTFCGISLKDVGSTYGAGFGLLVAAWVFLTVDLGAVVFFNLIRK